MDLSIITVTWNCEKFIAEQILSVQNGCQNISFEQIIVDNGSVDNTVALVHQMNRVTCIVNRVNAGFAAANNQGAKIAKGEFLLFLNPDTRVMPGSLDIIVQWMREHQDVGLASCKLVDETGNLNFAAQPRRFPGLADQLALILKIPHLFPGVLNRYLFKDFNPDKEQEVDSVRGSFMLLRREIYDRLGWAFDPRYFIWFEDVDLCREVKRLGLKVVYTPVITAVDYVGQSFKQRATFWKQRQFTRSMLSYFKKWEPRYKSALIALARPVGVAMAWFYDKLSLVSSPRTRGSRTSDYVA